MQRAYKYRFYPTPKQEILLRKTVGCCRFVYNRALETRTNEWVQNKERTSGYDLQKKLTQWKNDAGTEWLKEVSNVALQQSINNLEVAFQNFFAKRAEYPKFKKLSSGGSCRFTTCGFRIKLGAVWLAKTEAPLDIRWSRPLPEGVAPKQCTVKLTSSGEWYISFLCDVDIEELSPTKKHTGLDMGITTLITTSDGDKITNPKPYRTYKNRLPHEQKHLARKVKGSKNREKARLKVARIHQKISNIRKDQMHKLSTQLVRENQSIAIEDSSVRAMRKNHFLPGSISDSGWRMFRDMLDYKCDWYGRELRVVDRWFPSSKTCHACGHIANKLPLSMREWTCSKCSATHDRDINSAKNILAAGIVVNACGGGVRPKGVKVTRLSSVKQEPTRRLS